MKNSLILGTPFTADLLCDSSCIPIWEVIGDAFCENSVSYVIQSDGCGNSRTIEGGSACCIPDWKPRVPATGRCNNNVSEILQEDGCGSTRWVTGGANCCIPDWKVSPTIAAQCIDGVSKLTELDGCGNTRLVDGGDACAPPPPPEVLEYVGIIDAESPENNPDARVAGTNLGIYVCANSGSRHYPILQNLPDNTPIKLNPEWVVANKYCDLGDNRFLGKTLMAMQYVIDGPTEWLTVGRIRNNPAEFHNQQIEWNVIQELSNCRNNPGKPNKLYFTESDLSKFPPVKTNTSTTYYFGLQGEIVGAVFSNSADPGRRPTGTNYGSRRQIAVFGDFYYDNGKYVITSINSANGAKDQVVEWPVPPYCSANTNTHEILYSCVAYSG